MDLRAFTDELVQAGTPGLSKLAGKAITPLQYTSIGALTGLTGHALKRLKHEATAGPYDRPPEGSFTGAAGWGGLSGLTLSQILKALAKRGK